MPQTVWFFFAFVIVLALIGLAAWLVRRFAGAKIGGNGKMGRMPRLAVIDAAAVDGRRRLVLIRRDNVEHLLMIGGPSDIVVEQNIARAQPQREGAPQRTPIGTDLPPRISPLPDAAGWDGEDAYEQPSLAPEPPRRAPPQPAERRMSDPFADFAPEPMTRPERDEPVRAERSEPVRARAEPRVPRASEAPARPLARPSRNGAEQTIAAADQNLAEMAQRLEAALRRGPAAANGQSPAPQVSQMDRIGAPPVAPEPVAASRPPRAEPETTPSKPAPQSLEDEMASLLGRPRSLK